MHFCSVAVRKACDFLIKKQRFDGGWGESYRSCEVGEWVEHEQTQVVNTAWALMTLMAAKYPIHGHIRKGIQVGILFFYRGVDM